VLEFWDSYWWVILALAAASAGCLWLYREDQARRRRSDFERKLQNLGAAREKLAKRSGDVREAPCAVCFEMIGPCDFAESNLSGGAELLR